MRRVWTVDKSAGLLLKVVGCLVILGTVGCGGGEETGTVKGTVFLGEEPFGDASLILVSPKSGQGSSTEVAADGTFSVESAIPVGTYTAYLTPKVDEEEMMQRMQEGLPPDTTANKRFPDKYQNEASSDLTVEVESGENEVTLKMEPR